LIHNSIICKCYDIKSNHLDPTLIVISTEKNKIVKPIKTPVKPLKKTESSRVNSEEKRKEENKDINNKYFI
jgi:hypothetical protein